VRGSFLGMTRDEGVFLAFLENPELAKSSP
jgi:hypothetical protein